MYAPESRSKFSSRELSNPEGNAWLRDLLASAGVGNPETAGTHSFKSTPLSWVAKWATQGEDYAGLRRLLGYHSSGPDQSMLVYSRDAMSAPLQLLQTVFCDVRNGALCQMPCVPKDSLQMQIGGPLLVSLCQ